MSEQLSAYRVVTPEETMWVAAYRVADVAQWLPVYLMEEVGLPEPEALEDVSASEIREATPQEIRDVQIADDERTAMSLGEVLAQEIGRSSLMTEPATVTILASSEW